MIHKVIKILMKSFILIFFIAVTAIAFSIGYFLQDTFPGMILAVLSGMFFIVIYKLVTAPEIDTGEKAENGDSKKFSMMESTKK